MAKLLTLRNRLLIAFSIIFLTSLFTVVVALTRINQIHETYDRTPEHKVAAASEQMAARGEEAQTMATVAIADARIQLMTMLFLSLLVSIGAAWWLRRSLQQRVETLGDQSERLARGEFAVDEVPREGTRDELTVIELAQQRVAQNLNVLTSQIRATAVASRDGDLSRRIDTAPLTGAWANLAQDVNAVLDEALGPVNAQAAVLQKMADGILTARIAEEFRGDHNRIKTAINQIAGIALDAMNEFDELVVTFEAGEFERRARAEMYAGDWQKIMAGLNQILASVHRTTQQLQAQNWVKTGISELGEQMRGDLTLADLARRVVAYLARYVDAQPSVPMKMRHFPAGSLASRA